MSVAKGQRIARVMEVVEHTTYGTLLDIQYLDGEKEVQRICASKARKPPRDFKPKPEDYGLVIRRSPSPVSRKRR
jgi:hypothetical protein